MEIESLRLDFQTLIITKPQNNSRAYQRRKKKKKKKKNPEEPRQRARLGLRVAWVATQVALCLGRVRVLKKKKKKNTLEIRKNSLKKEKKNQTTLQH